MGGVEVKLLNLKRPLNDEKDYNKRIFTALSESSTQ